MNAGNFHGCMAATSELHKPVAVRIRQCGFTLLELIVVICIVAVLAGMFLKRVAGYQEMAERANMQQTVSALQTALIMQMGHYMAESNTRQIRELPNRNPMDLLMQKPANYSGEIRMGRADQVKPGDWAYDVTMRELVYVPLHDENFRPAKPAEKWIRFRVRPLYDTTPGQGGQARQSLVGMTVSAVEPYEWMIKP